MGCHRLRSEPEVKGPSSKRKPKLIRPATKAYFEGLCIMLINPPLHQSSRGLGSSWQRSTSPLSRGKPAFRFKQRNLGLPPVSGSKGYRMFLKPGRWKLTKSSLRLRCGKLRTAPGTRRPDPLTYQRDGRDNTTRACVSVVTLSHGRSELSGLGETRSSSAKDGKRCREGRKSTLASDSEVTVGAGLCLLPPSPRGRNACSFMKLQHWMRAWRQFLHATGTRGASQTWRGRQPNA